MMCIYKTEITYKDITFSFFELKYMISNNIIKLNLSNVLCNTMYLIYPAS